MVNIRMYIVVNSYIYISSTAKHMYAKKGITYNMVNILSFAYVFPKKKRSGVDGYGWFLIKGM